MVLFGFLVAQTNQSKRPGHASARPSLALERECNPDIDLLSLQVVEDVLQRLPFYWDTVATPRPQFFDDLEVRVAFDPGDEPTVISVNTVEQPELVEAEIEQDECASYPLAGGHLAPFLGFRVGCLISCRETS